jgi:hypothetical protein
MYIIWYFLFKTDRDFGGIFKVSRASIYSVTKDSVLLLTTNWEEVRFGKRAFHTSYYTLYCVEVKQLLR